MESKPEEEELVEDIPKTRINDEIPSVIIDDFLLDAVRCPKCNTLLTLKPSIDKAASTSLKDMVKKSKVEPTPTMPALILCLPCKDLGRQTLICLKN